MARRGLPSPIPVGRATLCGDASWRAPHRRRVVRSRRHWRALASRPGTCRKPAAGSWRRSERCPRRRGFPKVASNPWLLLRLLYFGVEHHGRRARDAPILTNAPEVQDHEDRSDDGNADAMPDVGAQQGVGVHDGAAEQTKAHIVVRSNERRSERAFITETWGGTRHVGAYGHGPKAELIVGQQITGEGEQQRQHQQDYADVPIELARLLVGAGEE